MEEESRTVPIVLNSSFHEGHAYAASEAVWPRIATHNSCNEIDVDVSSTFASEACSATI